MASLICWASGMLEVAMDKDVPPAGGPVVLMTGTAGRLRSVMTAHGEYREYPNNVKGWYVPGTQPIPQDKEAAAAMQRENMTLVMAFNQKLYRSQLKGKGLRHLQRYYRGEE